MPGRPKAPSTLDGHAADIWQSAFMSAYEGTCKERKDRDACAASVAWAAVKNKYRKSDDGTWVERQDGQAVVQTPATDAALDKTDAFRDAYERALAGECKDAPVPEECARQKAEAETEGKAMESKQMTSEGEGVVERKEFTPEAREAYSDKGVAMEDGSFPIPDVASLKDAIRAFGRSKDKEAAKRHIRKRARALGATELLPEGWQEKSVYGQRLVFDPDAIAMRRMEREMAEEKDTALIERGMAHFSVIRPEGISSQFWMKLAPSERTVQAMVMRNRIERTYLDAVDTALEDGWEASPNPTRTEEFVFRKWMSTPDGPVLVRAVLVRRGKDETNWFMRELSRGIGSSLAVRVATDEHRFSMFGG